MAHKEKEIISNSTKTLLLFFVISIASSSLLIFNVFFDITPFIVRIATRVSEGSGVHEFLKKEVAASHMSAYLFNITNSERFKAGLDDKLIVEEIGPFTYKEVRRNEDLELDPASGTMRYKPKIDLIFVPEESIGRPQDINVTVPNVPMLGITSNVNRYPYIVRLGFDVLTGQLHSKAIVTMDAHNYLWGYREPLVSIAHTVIPDFIPFGKMGLLDRMYDKKSPNSLELYATDDKKFMIKTRNGFTKLTMTEDDDENCHNCDSLDNTYEGMIYPCCLTPDFPVRLFRNGLCKTIEMTFSEKRIMDYGGEAFVYNISNHFFNKVSEKKPNGLLSLPECYYGAYCLIPTPIKTPFNLPSSNIFTNFIHHHSSNSSGVKFVNMLLDFKLKRVLLGMPLAMSKPHFLGIDKKQYERIEGIHPDPNKHDGYAIIEPLLGIEIDTVLSLQLNLVVGDVTHNPETKSFSDMVLPICYIKMVQQSLDTNTRDVLDLLYSTRPLILLAVKMMLYLLTFTSWAYFISLLCRRHICSSTRKELLSSNSFEKSLPGSDANDSLKQSKCDIK